MSHQLISHSPDLARLREEGYEISVTDGHLVLGHVPYLDCFSAVQVGTLVSTLTLASEKATKPDNHIAHFQGAAPHGSSGEMLTNVINSACPGKKLSDNIEVDFVLSSKPPGGYDNYYTKMTTYVNLIMQHALVVDPQATAQTFPVVRDDADESPFAYTDTASSHAGISAIVSKVKRMRIAIVGVGGTGSYILDLLAKCPVAEIHLYDGDKMQQRNTFRIPGALGLEELETAGNKAEYHARVYRKFHLGVQAHPYPIDDQTPPSELAQMDFVFVAVDDNPARGHIINALSYHQVPFIDVGIGMQKREKPAGDNLGGSARTTLVDWDPNRDHTTRIPTQSHKEENIYGQHIQIAEINALNAALAIIRWKRLVGIYDDLRHERHSVYNIDSNIIINDDRIT